MSNDVECMCEYLPLYALQGDDLKPLVLKSYSPFTMTLIVNLGHTAIQTREPVLPGLMTLIGYTVVTPERVLTVTCKTLE